MEFDFKRFSKLAGLSDAVDASSSNDVTPASSAQRLVESTNAKGARSSVITESADVKQLRQIVRREAKRMIQERLGQQKNPNVEKVQSKKSLSEAVAMGFAGIGFGGTSPALGGPMTSARRIVSTTSAASSRASALSDSARGELEIKAKMLGMIQEEIDELDDLQLLQVCSVRR